MQHPLHPARNQVTQPHHHGDWCDHSLLEVDPPAIRGPITSQKRNLHRGSSPDSRTLSAALYPLSYPALVRFAVWTIGSSTEEIRSFSFEAGSSATDGACCSVLASYICKRGYIAASVARYRLKEQDVVLLRAHIWRAPPSSPRAPGAGPPPQAPPHASSSAIS